MHAVPIVWLVIVKLYCRHSAGQGSSQLKEFLEARNPRQDHSLSLPALFAKPIVVSLEWNPSNQDTNEIKYLLLDISIYSAPQIYEKCI